MARILLKRGNRHDARVGGPIVPAHAKPYLSVQMRTLVHHALLPLSCLRCQGEQVAQRRRRARDHRVPGGASSEDASRVEVCCVFPVAPAVRCRECHTLRTLSTDTETIRSIAKGRRCHLPRYRNHPPVTQSTERSTEPCGMRVAAVSVSREAQRTAAMSGHDAVLRGCVLRTGQLLHLGLGQILTVDRDIGPTLGALKDGHAPLVLQ
jgi:hypothetical protein